MASGLIQLLCHLQDHKMKILQMQLLHLQSSPIVYLSNVPGLFHLSRISNQVAQKSCARRSDSVIFERVFRKIPVLPCGRSRVSRVYESFTSEASMNRQAHHVPSIEG